MLSLRHSWELFTRVHTTVGASWNFGLAAHSGGFRHFLQRLFSHLSVPPIAGTHYSQEFTVKAFHVNGLFDNDVLFALCIPDDSDEPLTCE